MDVRQYSKRRKAPQVLSSAPIKTKKRRTRETLKYERWLTGLKSYSMQKEKEAAQP